MGTLVGGLLLFGFLVWITIDDCAERRSWAQHDRRRKVIKDRLGVLVPGLSPQGEWEKTRIALDHWEALERLPEIEWLPYLLRAREREESSPRTVYYIEGVSRLLKEGWVVQSHTQRYEPLFGFPTPESWLLTPPLRPSTRDTP